MKHQVSGGKRFFAVFEQNKLQFSSDCFGDNCSRFTYEDFSFCNAAGSELRLKHSFQNESVARLPMCRTTNPQDPRPDGNVPSLDPARVPCRVSCDATPIELKSETRLLRRDRSCLISICHFLFCRDHVFLLGSGAIPLEGNGGRAARSLPGNTPPRSPRGAPPASAPWPPGQTAWRVLFCWFLDLR